MGLSIPFVSDRNLCSGYYQRMLEDWRGWAERLRAHKKAHHMKWALVAERMELEESAIRHWLNGTRQINLVDFFRLCKVMEADPQYILFGDSTLDNDQKKALAMLLKGAKK